MGTVLDDALLGRSYPRCRLAHERRLHPTRIRTPAARPRRVGRLYPGSIPRAGPDALAFPRSRPFKAAGSSPGGDVPFVAARVRGRRRGPVPGGGRWAGEGVSVTPRCHRSFESPAVPGVLLGPAFGLSPFPLPRPPTPPGVSITISHRPSSSRGFLFVTTGEIGVPSIRLAARARAPNAPPGRTVTAGCHSPSASDRASSLGLTRLAPVRLRLADPPDLSAGRTGRCRRPSGCAARGRPRDPACGRRSTAPCRRRACSGAVPGTPSAGRPSGRRGPRPR